MNKKLLVIVPIYNKEEFLRKAIVNNLQQTYKNIRLVLVDDCSTDRSLEIARSYEHLDNVTVLVNTENKGCYYTINKALWESRAEEWDYFTMFGADDNSDIHRFEKLIKYFDDTNLLGLKSTFIRVDRNLKPQLHRNGTRTDIFASEGIAFYSRKTFNKLGYFDNTRFSGDTDYWWRLEAFCAANPQYRTGQSDEILYLALNHENNLTKIYDFETERPMYWNRVKQEIFQMTSTGNFYREIFE